MSTAQLLTTAPNRTAVAAEPAPRGTVTMNTTPTSTPTSTPSPTPTDTPNPTPAHWVVQTASGLSLHVPASLRSLSTYVLLEQEAWFEPEMSLLPHLLQGGVHALDIGANHGVVALEMALASGTGRVWAFEPTRAPREALLASVQLNGLGDRVTVLGLAVADAAGQARFEVQDNSELNAREGNAAVNATVHAAVKAAVVGAAAAGASRPGIHHETVQVDTLDNVLQARGITQPIGFVKLDAEGDELRVLAGARRFFAQQSPVVLFEFKHGHQVNSALLDAWNGLGYGIFRWSAELQLLLPFDPARAETAFALNLVALRQPEQQHWAARGLLVTAAALVQVQEALHAEVPKLSPELSPALSPAAAIEAAHSRADWSPAQRLLCVLQARDSLLTAPDPGISDWVLLVHCLHALGQPLAAVQLGAQLLQQWPDEATSTGGVTGLDPAGAEGVKSAVAESLKPSCAATPLMPPLRSQMARAQHGSTGAWLRQMLAEYVALHSSYSSYFEAPAPQRWAALLAHPDHGAQIERRCLLAHVLGDRILPAALLGRLHHLGAGEPAHNARLWRGIIDSMRVMADAAARPAAQRAAQLAALPADVLATLPVARVAVVDVGASPLGTTQAHSPEPYAALVKAQRAHVTGFEPDAQALRALHEIHPNTATHRFLPHFVGDGAAAVFHETEWPLTASLFEPQREQLDRYHQLGALVQEKARHAVQTVRLDDAIPAGGMDLLKIDVQGAERLVFDGAKNRLDECLMVWTEVEFVPLYKGQPLFAEIDQRLRLHGLQFLCFVGLASRSLATWPVPNAQKGSIIQAPRPPQRPQQLWADAIYVPNPERMAALDSAAAAKLALLAHHVAAAYDLCHAALLRFDEVSDTHFATRYLAACR